MIHQSKHRRANRRRGATTVEMAVVLPVFLLLVFAIFEFGRAIVIKQALAEAARAGARTSVLATTQTSSQVESAAKEYFQQVTTSSWDLNQLRVTVSHSDLGSLETGTTITTSVEVNFADVTWILPNFIAGGVLQGESSMTKE